MVTLHSTTRSGLPLVLSATRPGCRITPLARTATIGAGKDWQLLARRTSATRWHSSQGSAGLRHSNPTKRTLTVTLSITISLELFTRLISPLLTSHPPALLTARHKGPSHL